MVPMREMDFEEASHEPANPVVQNFVAYATKVRLVRFTAPKRDSGIEEALHEPDGGFPRIQSVQGFPKTNP
jgi:hypothetical protein